VWPKNLHFDAAEASCFVAAVVWESRLTLPHPMGMNFLFPGGMERQKSGWNE
jgi:hypothetical protein